MEFEGRRRWLGLLAATLALPGCVSMGPRPEPRQALPADWDNRGEVAARTETPPRWWTAFEDAELDALAERALAGNLTLAQAAQRLKAARALSRSSAAQALPQIGSHGAAQRQHRLSGPHGANELSGAEAGRANYAGAGRTVHRLLPGRFRRPLGTRPVRPHRRRHGRGARERRRRRSRLARGQGVGGRRGRARLHRTARAQRRHQVLSGLLDDQRHLLALVQERRRAGIASDFDVDRASAGSRNGRPVAAVGATGAAARAASGGAYRREPDRARCWRPPASPCRAASRPRRCRPISCASGRTSVARNSSAAGRGRTVCRSPSIPAPDLSGDIQITGNLTGKPCRAAAPMRRAGCPDPAAAGLGLATAVAGAREAELAAAILAIGRSCWRPSRKPKTPWAPGRRKNGARSGSTRICRRRGGRTRTRAVVRARHDQSAGTPERVGRASPGGVGRGRGVGGTGVGVRGGEQGDGGGGV